MPNNILKMFVLKVFQLVWPFLANLHFTSIQKIFVYVPKILLFLFLHLSVKIGRILRCFLISENNWGKFTQKKWFAKIFASSNIKENILYSNFANFFSWNFFVSKFFAFSQHFRNQRKILCCFDTRIQILCRKSV